MGYSDTRRDYMLVSHRLTCHAVSPLCCYVADTAYVPCDAYQGHSIHQQVRQHLGVDLSLGADVAVPPNLGIHVVLALTMA